MAEITDKPKNGKGNYRGMNPKSQANLKPFPTGASANPAGRPPKPVCVTSWLKEYADQKISQSVDIKNLTYAQAAALKAWQIAVKGDLGEYQFIIDRLEGKVTQTIGGEGGKPIEVMIDYRSKFLDAVSRFAARGSEGQSSKEP